MAAEMTNAFELNDFRENLMDTVSSGESESECLGVITRKDSENRTWVHLIGGVEDTPTSSTTIACKTGDMVRCRVENGKVWIIGNLSSTGVNVSLLSNVISAVVSGDTNNVKAYAGNFDELKALTATIDQLTSVMATIGYLESNYINAKAIETDYMKAKTIQANFLNVDFGNFDAAQANAAAIRDLFAKTGLFNDLTVLGDGTVTGTLNATLLNGDTAMFSNIFADALKILGPDGLYHALNMRELNENDPNKAQIMIDTYGEALNNGLHGSHIIAESITADKIDVTSLMAAMLMSQFVQIGANGGIHIESIGNRMSFLIGGASLQNYITYSRVYPGSGVVPSENGYYELIDGRYVRTYDTSVVSGKAYYRLTDNTDPYTAIPGEVAYISVDPETGESVFYMTHTIVLKTMKFGNWMLFERANKNLALKWIGYYDQGAPMTADV